MSLPKIELHYHLEGGAPPELIRELARRHGEDISGIFAPEGGYLYRDFARFLKVYEAVTSVLRQPEDYARLTRTVLENAAQAGVIYLETFLSPDFCGGGDVAAWRDYLHAIAEVRVPGIELRGVVTCIRHFGGIPARRSALCAAETAGDFIVGFGMAGEEGAGRAADFAYAFDMAREAGLGLTAHAGEWGGPASVRDVLTLGVSRIGHGIGAAQDPALVAQLAGTGVVLEVCPGSNVALRAVAGWAAHPIDRLRRAGVAVTVSTDDPAFFATTMEREYTMLAETFGWAEADFTALNRVAARAAFCDDLTRARLLKHLEAPDV
ncbi:adenosine deaminase [Rhodovulum imhoffii]|uniref:Adenosine deaminase n=1 Tax=Rhodovulum imhoffii TaxID=365340 RepID=A0A2T5BSZ5_9RHOB|nr:adenosine deaminase [Rhodovulum imhoffii]MBK5932683.1 adenosine deaminase [Rhodovulum imhoffii]PTN02501.1 adenosine deaminase [Rhodovulum imhoffii]